MDINFTTNLDYSDGGQAGSVTPAATITKDFAAVALFEESQKALTTAYSDISLPSVGWTNITYAGWINKSVVAAEVITIGRHSQVIAGLVKDADTAGGAVPATLTAGHYTEISTAGTSQGKTWEAGDLAIYLGVSGTYAQLRPAPIASLKNGETAQMRIPGDGVAWKAKSALGAPLLGYVVLGALAE